MRSLTAGLVTLALGLVASCGGKDTGLLDLTLTADPQHPPPQAVTIDLLGSGGIHRSYAGKFPPDGSSSLRLEYPDLPAGTTAFSVQTLDGKGCVVGESPAPFQVAIKAGTKVVAATAVLRSSRPCGDGAGLDAGRVSDGGQTGEAGPIDLGTPAPDVATGPDLAPDAAPNEASLAEAGQSIDAPADLPLPAVDAPPGSPDTPSPATPTIVSFTANPATISVGSSTTLTAIFRNATGSSIDHGIGSVTSGNGVGTGPLSSTTTYKLTISDATGASFSQTVTVTVVPLPSITSFTALVPAIARGTLTQLNGTFTGGIGNIDNNIGAVTSGVGVPTGVLFADTMFTLTVTNAAGDSTNKAATVTVSTTVGPGTFTATGSMVVARVEHTATLLGNGKVLIVGGGHAAAELYDPATGTFTLTGKLSTDRVGHTATLLRNGKVLIAGGDPPDRNPTYSEPALYDPATGTFAVAGAMVEPRADHTATLLLDGRVLIAGGGGESSAYLATAEVYDPAKDSFTQTGQMSQPRTYFTASLLPDGHVLVAGGDNVTTVPPRGFSATAETWDPISDRFTPTGSMFYSRCVHIAVALTDGKVLVAGGVGDKSPLLSAEIYDPTQRSFGISGALQISRYQPGSTLLPNGKALVMGTKWPVNDGDSSTSEIYTPPISGSGSFTLGPNMTTARRSPTATLLPDGAVLVADGSTAELYW